MIPFRQIYQTGHELPYLQEVLAQGQWASDGPFGRYCEQWLCTKGRWQAALLTASCTDALEMAALLTAVGPGDEVILPAYTFPSTANAFLLRGAVPVWADCRADHPTISAEAVAELITPRTRVIVAVHYGGYCAELDKLRRLADARGLVLIEDAAQAWGSVWQDQPAGSIGDLATVSFHESKPVSCGEGGALAVNRLAWLRRAHILRDKGTNRLEFRQGLIEKYDWEDLGSSFGLAETSAALLRAQLEAAEAMQAQRHQIWVMYSSALGEGLRRAGFGWLDDLPGGRHNASTAAILCPTSSSRQALAEYLGHRGIGTAFHYQALHRSPYCLRHQPAQSLPHAERFSDGLLRLPLFNGMREEQAIEVIRAVLDGLRS